MFWMPAGVLPESAVSLHVNGARSRRNAGSLSFSSWTMCSNRCSADADLCVSGWLGLHYLRQVCGSLSQTLWESFVKLLSRLDSNLQHFELFTHELRERVWVCVVPCEARQGKAPEKPPRSAEDWASGPPSPSSSSYRVALERFGHRLQNTRK